VVRAFKVLVVEDEKPIADILEYNLAKEGYDVKAVYSGDDAVEEAIVFKPDLILLDIMLPGIDGLNVCRQVRQNLSCPIIMLTAKDSEIDKVLGLELGAYDYVTKPFSPRELVSRVKANLRRGEYMGQSKDEKEIQHRDLVIRSERYEAFLNGNRLDLTPKEFEILVLLASSPGRVFTRDILLEKIWGINEFRETRTVDVHIRYLRQKVERDPATPEIIETIRGIGYRFNDTACKYE